MSGSDPTMDAIKRAFATLMLLPNVPTMTPELWLAMGNLFASEGVTQAELGLAATHVAKHEKFWPAPSVILEHIREARKAQGQVRSKTLTGDPDTQERGNGPRSMF